jgi:hypothetical protein
MITLKLKIGKNLLEYQAENLKDVFRFSSILGALPEVCDNCQSQDVFLNYRKTKENFDYYLYTCKKCGAEITFGQKKEGGFFIKSGDKMRIYKKETSNEDKIQETFGQPSNDEPQF